MHHKKINVCGVNRKLLYNLVGSYIQAQVIFEAMDRTDCMSIYFNHIDKECVLSPFCFENTYSYTQQVLWVIGLKNYLSYMLGEEHFTWL